MLRGAIAWLPLLLLPQDPVPDARAAVERVSAFLKDRPVVEFETEMRTRIGSAVAFSQKTKVILKRPHLARLDISGAGQDAALVLDGAHSWHLLKARNRYVKTRQRGTAKLEQYGAGLAVPLFFQGVEPLLPYLASATSSKELLDGRECRVVAWSVGAEEVKLWIDGDRLRRVRTTRSLADQQVEQTITYGAMTFPATAEAGVFTFAPPPGSEPLPPSGEERLLKPGAKAPDVAGLDLQGNPIKLSDFKGRPLLVTFWFHG